MLVVDDIDAARAELLDRGVAVSETFHDGYHPAATKMRMPGPDPEGRSYLTFASFSDPDDNVWLVQEVKTRLPGRVETYQGLLLDAASLTELLRETEKRHGELEASGVMSAGGGGMRSIGSTGAPLGQSAIANARLTVRTPSW